MATIAKTSITFSQPGKINSGFSRDSSMAIFLFLKYIENASKTIKKLQKKIRTSGVSKVLTVPSTLSAWPIYLMAENCKKLCEYL